MTIGEALLASKENGKAYSAGGAWIKWVSDGQEYRLPAYELISEEWELLVKDEPSHEVSSVRR